MNHRPEASLPISPISFFSSFSPISFFSSFSRSPRFPTGVYARVDLPVISLLTIAGRTHPTSSETASTIATRFSESCSNINYTSIYTNVVLVSHRENVNCIYNCFFKLFISSTLACQISLKVFTLIKYIMI